MRWRVQTLDGLYRDPENGLFGCVKPFGTSVSMPNGFNYICPNNCFFEPNTSGGVVLSGFPTELIVNHELSLSALVSINLAPLGTIGSELGIKASEVLPVLEAAREVIKKSLYKASGEVDYNAIVNNCDPSLDDRLKKLIAKVVGMYLLAIIDLRIFLFTNR